VRLLDRLRAALREPAEPRDGVLVALVGLALRLGVVAWAAARIPPAADGAYFHVIAQRIARGDGYTWLWPDGAVTYAAHYPVGYPGLVGGLYAAFGVAPWSAMVFNAALGALAVWAVHRMVATTASRAGALLAALGVALHPALVAYTPALMTEGVTAALWAIAAALVAASVAASGRGRIARLVALGVVLGCATLVRPQSLLLAPFFGWLSCGRRSVARRALWAALVSALAVAVCLPWSIRNCVRMERCLLVSANGGWNLLIGTADSADGGWVPLERVGVPRECSGVFGEAAKDDCYGKAALRTIADRPLGWLLLAPRKLAVTFDYAGAAGWYLHTANAASFTDRDKLVLGVLETIWQRVLLAFALAAMAVAAPLRRARLVLLVLAAPFVVLRPAWVAYLGLAGAAGLLGWQRPVSRHLPAALASVTILATAAAHAAFFGSGRYSLVVMPFVATLAGCALGRRPGADLFDTDARRG